MKSYVRNTINLSCAKILLTSVIISVAVKNKYNRKTLEQVGEELDKKVLGPFVNVFLILAVEVS